MVISRKIFSRNSILRGLQVEDHPLVMFLSLPLICLASRWEPILNNLVIWKEIVKFFIEIIRHDLFKVVKKTNLIINNHNDSFSSFAMKETSSSKPSC